MSRATRVTVAKPCKGEVKDLLKHVADIEGEGTGMVTLMVPGRAEIAAYSRFVTAEAASASRIRDRV